MMPLILNATGRTFLANGSTKMLKRTIQYRKALGFTGPSTFARKEAFKIGFRSRRRGKMGKPTSGQTALFVSGPQWQGDCELFLSGVPRADRPYRQSSASAARTGKRRSRAACIPAGFRNDLCAVCMRAQRPNLGACEHSKHARI